MLPPASNSLNLWNLCNLWFIPISEFRVNGGGTSSARWYPDFLGPFRAESLSHYFPGWIPADADARRTPPWAKVYGHFVAPIDHKIGLIFTHYTENRTSSSKVGLEFRALFRMFIVCGFVRQVSVRVHESAT